MQNELIPNLLQLFFKQKTPQHSVLSAQITMHKINVLQHGWLASFPNLRYVFSLKFSDDVDVYVWHYIRPKSVRKNRDDPGVIPFVPIS